MKKYVVVVLICSLVLSSTTKLCSLALASGNAGDPSDHSRDDVEEDDAEEEEGPVPSGNESDTGTGTTEEDGSSESSDRSDQSE